MNRSRWAPVRRLRTRNRFGRTRHQLLPTSILFVGIVRLIDDFFVFLKPLVRFVPIEGDITRIGVAFIEGGLVGPSHIFFKSIAYSHGVVGRMALVGSKGRAVGSHHQIHTNVGTRKVIDGSMIGLEHEQSIRGIRDSFAAELHTNTFRRWLDINPMVGRVDKSRCRATRFWLLIHLVRSFLLAPLRDALRRARKVDGTMSIKPASIAIDGRMAVSIVCRQVLAHRMACPLRVRPVDLTVIDTLLFRNRPCRFTENLE